MSETQTREETRIAISQIVGTKPDTNALSKHDLNSIHAYLTGELLHRPDRVYDNGSKSRYEMLRHVLSVAEIDAPVHERSKPVTLRKNELESLLETLDNNPDKREWTP